MPQVLSPGQALFLDSTSTNESCRASAGASAAALIRSTGDFRFRGRNGRCSLRIPAHARRRSGARGSSGLAVLRFPAESGT